MSRSQNEPLLKLYHALPLPVRSLAASARGWQLRTWRYGRETDRLIEAALERETWSQERWRAYQQERLEIILRRSVSKVPYYRELWARMKDEGGSQGLEGEDSGRKKSKTINRSQPGYRAEGDWENLQNWPVLKKTVLRSRPETFVAEDCDCRRMFCEHTSGTTGTPLTLWQSRDTVRQWYALFEARWRRWYGLSRHDRWAILGGQLITPFEQKEPPFWVWNTAGHQLYLSTYHVAPRNADAYVEALKKHRVTYLWTYSSSAHALAQFILDQGLRPPELKAVITNAEPLYQYQRETIANAFHCRVFETYGMCEMVCAASECEAGKMHLWPEVGIYEVLHDVEDKPVKWGETGRLVCTGLLNRDMPLIRYEVGDRVAMAPPGEKCPCGRTLPILLSVEGRSDDVIVTPDGRRIGRLDPVFKGDIPMREGQIIQESLELIRVLVVPAREFTARHEQDLIVAVRERVGNIKVQVERVSEIPRPANGKFRAVISKVG
jgi:phenylacetate-CoA ligase